MAIKSLLHSRDEVYLSPELKRLIIGIFDVEYINYDQTLSNIRKICKLYIVDFKRVAMTESFEKMNFPTISLEHFDECF